jgi:protein SCO1
VVLLAAVIPAVFVPTVLCRSDPPKLDVYGTVAPFALTDERGAPFTDEALRGHVSIINFVFTRCTTICPVVSQRMEKVQEKTALREAAIKLVSFSVDPGYDTPARLAEFAKPYHPDPSRWRFVTGAEPAMVAVVEGSLKESMTPATTHSGRFVLVDPSLQIRGWYDSNDNNRLNQLMIDARYLLRTTKAK